MFKRNALIKILCLTLSVLILVGSMSACSALKGEKGDPGPQGIQGEPGKDGKDGTNGVNGTNGTDGKDGVNGTNGADGLTPFIGENGNWWIGTTDTGIRAAGQDGADGKDGANGADGTDGINGKDGLNGADGKDGIDGTDGKDGADGLTPFIGDNGNWWIGEADTGINATGNKGDKGDKGDTGVGIENILINAEGKVEITLTNGNKYTVDIVDLSCPHESYIDETILPTCLNKGYTKHTCKSCIYSYLDDYTPASGHQYYERYCIFCGEEESFGEIAYDTSWYDSSKSEFTLSSKEQLAGLAFLVNVNNITFANKKVYINNNIDLGGIEWVPIGNATTAFKGTFESKGFTISNLTISNRSEYVGLFGNASGTIQHLNIQNACISVADKGSYIGIAVGQHTGILNDISVSGYVDAPNSTNVGGIGGYVSPGGGDKYYSNLNNTAFINGADHVGGLFGSFYYIGTYNGYHGVYFTDFVNNGNITGTGDYVGGISGYMNIDSYASESSYKMIAEELHNTGDIGGNSYIGGLFGYCYTDSGDTSIAYSDSIGSVTAAEFYAGGIAGHISSVSKKGTMKEVTVRSAVSGQAYVGGLVGEGTTAFDTCSNDGSTITATGYFSDGKAHYAYLGGYIGKGICFSIKNCTNTVAIVYQYDGLYVGGIGGYVCPDGGDKYYSNLNNTADISGADCVGGLFGSFYYIGAYSGYRGVYFTNLANSGDITGGGNYVGGISGYMHLDGNANESSYKMIAEELNNTGNISGTSYIGGWFGHFYTDSGDTSVRNSYSGGKVTGSSHYYKYAGEQTNLKIKET